MPIRSLVSSDQDSGSAAAARDPGATIEAWRARGDHRRDPVRFRLIEVLAKRAAAHQGEVRRILDDKVLELLAAYAQDLGKVPSAQGTPGAAQKGQVPRGPLAELVDAMARPAPSQGDGAAASGGVPGSSTSTHELKTLSYFRSTWSRLSADRRLTQAMAAVPENAGPLNSHQLVHRALTQLRELSPEYLHRFMSHVDALLWLDQASVASASAGAETSRAEGQKKPGRGRSR